MEKKIQLECMDNECRTVMFGHFLDGMRCVNCGGPTRERPYNPVKKQNDQSKNRGLTIQVNVDTTEALKQMKELANVAYACVEEFEKLEKVMGRFTNKTDSLLIEVPVILKGKTIAQRVSEVADIKERF